MFSIAKFLRKRAKPLARGEAELVGGIVRLVKEDTGLSGKRGDKPDPGTGAGKPKVPTKSRPAKAWFR